ncbi:ureidoglycolate lyase [Burkholderia gladioli]|uniref:ureidoglycolate lyase n=1 Tax=Burkholderia gladioli TaxID=28095 RepID=UPI001640F2E1|nr:ureidoglycolate lyase [Burkholderia gladioli]MBJ9674089.1 ureidoglycolate lyase [Burkholderia gladioli]MDN7463209.1 ureidoglycolate lyase [Burkholderia gladioli]URV25404.1 ureidoglycolate lyase [Burkholderia gladioli]
MNQPPLPQALPLEPLTRAAFAPFGDVIELEGARHFPINGGTTERFHDLASVDVGEAGGRPLVNLFRGQPRRWPIEIAMMERHPLGSQAFVPLAEVGRYAVVVAPAGEFDPARLRAFLAEGWQGVNYARGVWHHPLLALDRVSDFVVIDRGGNGEPNCDEIVLDTRRLLLPPEPGERQGAA